MMAAGLREAIASAEIFKALGLETLNDLASFGAFRQFKKGEHVFYDRDSISVVYLVSQGLVSMYKTNFLGEKRVIFILGPGQLIMEGVADKLSTSVNCEAFEDSGLICFNQKKFLAAMKRDFELTKAVMESMSVRTRRLYRQLKNMSGSVRGDKRIAAKLWKLSRDHGLSTEKGVRINLKLSVTCLANMMGAKRETISRQLKVLMDQNLVEVRNGTFTIPNPDRLADYFKSES